MKAHLRAVKASTLCPLAENLTPAAGTEFTACVVPYVTMVTHRTLVQAAPLGSHTLLAALTGTLDFSLTLQGNTSSRLNWGQLCLCLQIWILKVINRSPVVSWAFVSACTCLFQTNSLVSLSAGSWIFKKTLRWELNIFVHEVWREEITESWVTELQKCFCCLHSDGRKSDKLVPPAAVSSCVLV